MTMFSEKLFYDDYNLNDKLSRCGYHSTYRNLLIKHLIDEYNLKDNEYFEKLISGEVTNVLEMGDIMDKINEFIKRKDDKNVDSQV